MGLLGSLTVRFGGDTSGLVSAAKQAGNILSTFKDDPMKAVSMGMIAAGAAVVGFGVASVKMASDYQRQMNMVQALTGANTQQMASYDSQLKALAISAGVAPAKLASGLYNVLSAGYQGADALKVLTLATQDAKIGLTDSATTSNALTVALRAFNVPASQFVAVNGEMLRTVTAGKMTMQDYASAISKTSSVAVQYKDSMSDMNAVLATLTSSGIKNANVAGTDYNNLLKVLNGNTDKMTKAILKFDPSFSQAGFAALSMKDKVATLNTILTEHGKNFSDVVGKQQNAAAAYTMLSTHMSTYSSNLKALSDNQANASATQSAWSITQGGFAQTMSRLSAAVQVLMINVGSKLLPVLTVLAGWVTNLISNFIAWNDKTNFVQNALAVLGQIAGGVWKGLQIGAGIIGNLIGVIKDIVGWVIQWHTPLLVVAGAITLFLLPALIAMGVQAGITGATMAGTFIANIVKAGLAMVVSAGQAVAGFVAWAAGAWAAAAANVAAFWPVYLIVGAIIAVIGIVILVIKNWGAIAKWLQGVWSGIKTFFIGLWNGIMQALTPLINFFKVVFNIIWGIIQVVLVLIINLFILAFNVIKTIVTPIVNFFQMVWNGIAAIWSVVSGWFGALFTAAWHLIVTIFTPIIKFFIDTWNKIVAVWNVVAGFFSGIFTAAWNAVVKIFTPIGSWFGDRWKDIQNVLGNVGNWFHNLWQGVVNDFKSVFNTLGSTFQGIWNGVTGVVKGAINWVIDRINNLIDVYNKLPKFGAPNISHIPHLATGGQITQGGMALVGERGAEYVSLPSGSAVYPHGSMPASASGGASGDQTIIMQLDGTTIAKMVGDRQARLVRLQQGRRAA